MPQIAKLVPVAYLAVSGLWTADDPFVGKWKLDASRSSIVDQMAVEAAGPNKYTFRFEGGPPETVTADGTDQPGMPGTTLAVKAGNAHSMKVVRKQNGKIIVWANWTLSDDGRVLHDAFSSVQPNGAPLTVDYIYKRRSGMSGFTGLWESTTQPLGLQLELQVLPFGGKGLSFIQPGSEKSIVFDGHDHSVIGTAQGVIASGRRESRKTLTYTEKSNGAVIDTRDLSLSTDGKALTITVKRTGQDSPNVLVLERE
jgi:hypothetical protein